VSEAANATTAGAVRRPLAASIAALALAVALAAAAVSLAVVAARGPAPEPAMQARVRAIAATLRCPVCQDLSVADSPSPLARQMRGVIAADLAAGMSPQVIRDRFVAQYGEWILLVPPRRGIDLVAWILPIVLLAAGIAVAVGAIRRWTRAAGPSAAARASGADDPLTAADRRLLDRALASSSEEPE
jgi:cytochrome c-type biogenesis protein CcmH